MSRRFSGVIHCTQGWKLEIFSRHLSRFHPSQTCGAGPQPPKTARTDLRRTDLAEYLPVAPSLGSDSPRTQPCLSPRQVSPAATRPVSPAVPATARLSRTNSPAQIRHRDQVVAHRKVAESIHFIHNLVVFVHDYVMHVMFDHYAIHYN